MTRKYLVIYERGAKNWSAFAPDLLGCGSMGDDLDETRANVREAIELYLSETAESGEAIPDATTTSVDFQEFDPNHEVQQYIIEWLAVTLPTAVAPSTETQAA